ncbi:MAG TPA: L-cystine transporter, partial [Enterococcus sp.]|nr:L-cystine transporter [Enterococcus sp.]
MTNLLTVIVVLIFSALIYGFYLLQKRHVKFSTRVFGALFAGIVFGGILQLVFGTGSDVVAQSLEWITMVGSGYVALLQMLIMPLIFVSIVGAFTKMKESEKIKKISFTVLATLLGTTAIAALIGITMVMVFGLDGASFTEGATETARIAELAERSTQVQDLSIPQQIVAFIPSNVFADFAGTR